MACCDEYSPIAIALIDTMSGCELVVDRYRRCEGIFNEK